MAKVECALDDHVLTVRMNRPERRNAMDGEMAEGLAAAFDRAAADPDVRVVLLLGEGKDFSAGGDLKNMDALLAADAETRSANFRNEARNVAGRLFGAMERVPQPIVAATRGHVIGAGVQMAAVADLVVASETSHFSLPNVSLAHVTDHGETWHVRRKIGPSRFMQMVLLGERLDAAAAERFGLVNFVVPDDRLEAEAAAVAARITAQPPVAAREMKALLTRPTADSFEAQREREEEALGRAVAAEDFVEAIRAFGEKRAPVYSGR